MSYHLVHILQHGSRLSIDRGCLVCQTPEKSEKRAPLQDILAIIIAARGISFSADCLSSLIKNGAIILHCDERYRPIGKTIGLSSVVHNGIFEKQIARQTDFSENLWKLLLKSKIENQATILDLIDARHKLRQYLSENIIDEGNTARHYWSHYFSRFGKKRPDVREHQNARNPVNQLLNYSYAVMGAIIHRSIVIHGLNPTLGIHHKYRFKSDPLVYDLLEPLRPFCDFLLLGFHLSNHNMELQEWTKYAAKELINLRIKIDGHKSLKLLYAVDYYVSAIANCFYYGYNGYIGDIFVPKLCSINTQKCD